MLGQKQNDSFKRPIEFVRYLNAVGNVVVNGECKVFSTEAMSPPNAFNYIELICKDYMGGMDLMFAYDVSAARGTGLLIVGYFNDGVVS